MDSMYMYDIKHLSLRHIELVASRGFHCCVQFFRVIMIVRIIREECKRNLQKFRESPGTDLYLPFWILPRKSDSSGKAGISRYDLCDYDLVGTRSLNSVFFSSLNSWRLAVRFRVCAVCFLPREKMHPTRVQIQRERYRANNCAQLKCTPWYLRTARNCEIMSTLRTND